MLHAELKALVATARSLQLSDEAVREVITRNQNDSKAAMTVAMRFHGSDAKSDCAAIKLCTR